MRAGGSVTNLAGARIDALSTGIFMTSGTGYIDNQGSINGEAQGIYLIDEPATVVNGKAGAIYGGQRDGIYIRGAKGKVINDGIISGSSESSESPVGVALYDGGSVYNGVGAQIGGSYSGISVWSGGATIENAGTIGGRNFAVIFHGGRLIIDGGAVFHGEVATRSGTTFTIELTAKTGPGVLSGLGTQYQGVAGLTVDTGANWMITGSLGSEVDVYGAETGGILNDGYLRVHSGGVANADILESGAFGTVSSGGETSGAEIASGGTLTVIGGEAENPIIDAGGTLYQYDGNTAGSFADNPTRFQISGDAFILGGVAYGGEVFSGGSEFAGASSSGAGGGFLISSLVHSGGVLAMGAHGVAQFATIEAGGTLFELAGDTFDIALAGTQYVGGGLPGVPPSNPPQPAVASGTNISCGGREIVNSNGTAISSIIQSGGEIQVNSGGVAIGAMVSSGGIMDAVNAEISGMTVFAGGVVDQFVGTDAYANLSGGELLVLNGAMASHLSVGSGGLVVTGEFAGGTTGGVVTGGTIEAGGTLVQGQSSEASVLTVDHGATLLELTGVTSNIMLAGTQFVATTLFGPAEPAFADGTIVESGGVLDVAADGSAINTSVQSGGEIVFGGGVVSGLSLSSGGMIDLAAFTFRTSTKIGFAENAADTGGTLTISGGAGGLSIVLLGQYVAAGFRQSRDRGGHTLITYSGATAGNVELAAHH
jgi:autotransporter passenger strand-loop-strand repeat protein